MARIVRLHALGGPEVLRIDDVPTPEPGAGEVRVGVKAIGLNRVEAMYRSGGFGTPELPARIGYEAAGIVEAVGEAVAGFAPGDRVAVLPGIEMGRYGTYGDQVLLPADMLVSTGDAQSFEASAATWMQYMTAFAIIEAGVGAGDTVAITAASSSVGLAAVQLVNAVGGVPIAVTRSDAKAEALRAAGARHVIASDDGRVTEALREATGGHGAAFAFDAVVGTLESLIPAMAAGGTIVLYGSLGADDACFNVHPFMLAGLTLKGFAAFQITKNAARRAAAIAFIEQGLTSGRLKPVIDRVFAFDRIVEAHRYLESNMQLGKIVVTV